MSFEYIQKIPTADEIKKELPLNSELSAVKAKRDEEIQSIFTRASNKFLLIIGPCSAHDENAVCDYVERLAKLQEKVAERLVLVPRIYTNKPRTTGEGYKGMGHQPNPTEKPDMVGGIKAIRKMHIRVLKEFNMSAADEMLYPTNHPYLDDIISYVAIGARSVENQQHRLTVSGLDVPAGMKNPTSGDITVMLNSVQAAQLPHDFIYHDWEVTTPGNPLAHCILRGSTDQDGRSIPNYHYESMQKVANAYMQRDLKNPTIIIDVSHANSDKKFAEQPRISMEVLEAIERSQDLKDMVRGMMIESFLVEGSKPAGQEEYGQSITDPCLGWEASEKLVLDIAEQLPK